MDRHPPRGASVNLDRALTRLERLFGIRLAESDLRSVQTVGDLERLLTAQVNPDPDGQGLCDEVLERLREALGDLFEVPPQVVQPETPTLHTLPQADLREIWDHLREGFDLRVPALRRKPEVIWVINALGLAGLALTLGVPLAGGPLGLAALLLLGTVFLFVGASFFTAHFAHLLPHGAETVAGFVGMITRIELDTLAAGRERWTQSALRDLLLAVLEDESGVPQDQITPASELGADLRLR